MNEQSSDNGRYWCWRYSVNDDLGDQLQQAIQEYVKRYGERPLLVLVPEGLDLPTPMSGLAVQQNERVPPFRYYFAVPQKEDDAAEGTPE
jgi:hypothetical protein